jgi:hypothetical protein
MEFLKQISPHLLILDGNGSLVILEAIKLAHQIGFKWLHFQTIHHMHYNPYMCHVFKPLITT